MGSDEHGLNHELVLCGSPWVPQAFSRLLISAETESRGSKAKCDHMRDSIHMSCAILICLFSYPKTIIYTYHITISISARKRRCNISINPCVRALDKQLLLASALCDQDGVARGHNFDATLEVA